VQFALKVLGCAGSRSILQKYILNQHTIISPFKASLSEPEHWTEGNLKWKKFNTDIIDLGSLKLNIKWWKTLNQKPTYQIIRHHIPEDLNLNIYCNENVNFQYRWPYKSQSTVLLLVSVTIKPYQMTYTFIYMPNSLFALKSTHTFIT
jgi:hypothetical protein